jgi:peptidoglycan/xylan/chitin deacetylase (PgdA/CDA1 family)
VSVPRCGGSARLGVTALLFLGLAHGLGAQEQAPRIAITIDDLPWNGPLLPEEREAATRVLLSTLQARGVKASGFVNCGRVPSEAPLLKLWLEHGMTLGNHSEAHRDINTAQLDIWLEDVRSCDERLREIVGGPVRYFRYPMLHQGPTAERREAAFRLLSELDYQIAHVTVDNSEFMLSRPYEEALRQGDETEAERLGDLLIEHILAMLHHSQDVARRKLGRDVDHILLLHATKLVADRMDALLDTLAAQGFSFISLEGALDDPVYRLPDAYIGPSGLSWLYRIEPLSPEDAAWDGEQSRLLREAIGSNR